MFLLSLSLLLFWLLRRRTLTILRLSDNKEKTAPTAAKHEKKEHGKPLTHDEPTSDEWATGAHGRAAGVLETEDWTDTMYTAPK